MDTTSISVPTSSQVEFVDVTGQIRRFIADSKIASGVCWAFVPHTTAGITINEGADPSVQADIIAHLAAMVPASSSFSHQEGNSPAHIKASIVGSSVSVFVEKGRLILGTWQAIYLCEFDGPRTRRLLLKISTQ